jgi:hypothetical protein
MHKDMTQNSLNSYKGGEKVGYQEKILPYATIQEIKPTWIKYFMFCTFLVKIKCSYLFYTMKITTLASLDGKKHSFL